MLRRIYDSAWTFPVTAGLLAFTWALIAWIGVVPNQDILVDGIQAQSFLTDPEVFLAFPGQRHAGPLEYPATIVAEWFAPGNYFANAAIRPFLAFITGFTAALLFRRLFEHAPRWAFLLSVAFGPAILSGKTGPASNPVGVSWLQPNYNLSWLFVICGSLLLAATLEAIAIDRRQAHLKAGLAASAAGAGVLIGLGFWAHPVIILLIAPLLILVALRMPWSWRALPWFLLGGVLGASPAVASYFINAGVNTWDPSHGALIAVNYYITKGGSVLGLDGIPDYVDALLPWAWGWAPTEGLALAAVQSAAMWVIVVAISAISVIGVMVAWREKRRPSALTAIALTWLTAIATMFAFLTFVSPVWIYSIGYAFLFWITVGAAPIYFAKRVWGTLTASVLLLVEAVSMGIHNREHITSVPTNFQNKLSVMNEKMATAHQLADAGVEVIFGSYYDAIPIGYASAGDLRTVMVRYNRIPLTVQELSAPALRIAVNSQPAEPWAEESLELIESECSVREYLPTPSGVFAIADCDPQVLDIRR